MPSSFGAVSPLIAMSALLSGQALPGILLPSYGFGDDGRR